MQKIKAIDLKVGDTIFWKTGNAADVISVEKRSNCVYVVCGGNIHVYDRELSLNKLVMVERKPTKIAKPEQDL